MIIVEVMITQECSMTHVYSWIITRQTPEEEEEEKVRRNCFHSDSDNQIISERERERAREGEGDEQVVQSNKFPLVLCNGEFTKDGIVQLQLAKK